MRSSLGGVQGGEHEAVRLECPGPALTVSSVLSRLISRQSEGRLQYLADQLTIHVVEDGGDNVQSSRVTPALIDLQHRQESAVEMQESVVTL